MKTELKHVSKKRRADIRRRMMRQRLKQKRSRQVVAYTGTQDAEHIVKQLDGFVFEPARKDEVQKKYELLKKYIKAYD